MKNLLDARTGAAVAERVRYIAYGVVALARRTFAEYLSNYLEDFGAIGPIDWRRCFF